MQDALVAAMERWRADLVQQLDRIADAREAPRQAIAWTGNQRECVLPLERGLHADDSPAGLRFQCMRWS